MTSAGPGPRGAAGPSGLSHELAVLLGRRHPRAVAVRVSDPTTPTAGPTPGHTVEPTTGPATEVAVLGGLQATQDLEIGSVSKALTGLLYADALERGEVTPTTTLRELLPLGDAPAGAVTLDALATHRSGLPRLPAAMHPWRRTLALLRHGTNPYTETRDELLAQVLVTPVGRARPAYSNLGFELLGHALAAAVGTTYAELLDVRLAQPLGLTGTYVPTDRADLRPGAVAGSTRRGRSPEPWVGEAVGPAGGVRSTAQDMARLLHALLDGSAPGAAALDPVADFGRGVRIGAGWLTLGPQGRQVTWHNGRTGGFASWIGADRAAGVGVAVMSATSASVDRAGFALLGGAASDAGAAS